MMNIFRLLHHVPAANVATLVLALAACAAFAAEPKELAPAPGRSLAQPGDSSRQP